jgi:molybdenum cofactor cytidylyltransferase
MIEAVVVAAGFSSRAGAWKMSLDIGGVTVIERLILGMIPYCSRIIVVGGYQFDLLQGLLPKQKYPMVNLIYHDDYPKGMYSSVLTGFRQVHGPRFFFIPGDYPFISGGIYQILLKQEGEIIIPSYRGATGHPVLFQVKAVEGLISNSSRYNNLRQYIAAYSPRIVEVPEPGILMDIDTWEDYLTAIRYFESGSLKTSGASFNP